MVKEDSKKEIAEEESEPHIEELLEDKDVTQEGEQKKKLDEVLEDEEDDEEEIQAIQNLEEELQKQEKTSNSQTQYKVNPQDDFYKPTNAYEQDNKYDTQKYESEDHQRKMQQPEKLDQKYSSLKSEEDKNIERLTKGNYG